MTMSIEYMTHKWSWPRIHLPTVQRFPSTLIELHMVSRKTRSFPSNPMPRRIKELQHILPLILHSFNVVLSFHQYTSEGSALRC